MIIIIETILKKLGWENNQTNRRLVVLTILFFLVLLIMITYSIFSFISWKLHHRKQKRTGMSKVKK
ncbi:MAG: hypothetical protein MRERV_30c004 [Mycoplasmataceae bacterium RV_VA103A]|nr:MAG: hypothetical protein MRERV_30c004 [Mycoplasmataceae bacterium RV_VA103A]